MTYSIAPNRHDITEILLKVASSTIIPTLNCIWCIFLSLFVFNERLHVIICYSIYWGEVFGPKKLAWLRHFLCKCLYQVRKVSGYVHVYMCVRMLILFPLFFDLILELFQKCGICFSFYYHVMKKLMTVHSPTIMICILVYRWELSY